MTDKNNDDPRAAAALEQQGDAAAAAGEPAEDLYRQVQKILLPTGVLWSDAIRERAFAELYRHIGHPLSGPTKTGNN